MPANLTSHLTSKPGPWAMDFIRRAHIDHIKFYIYININSLSGKKMFLCALRVLRGSVFFLPNWQLPKLAYDLHHLKYGKLRETLSLERISVNNK